MNRCEVPDADDLRVALPPIAASNYFLPLGGSPTVVHAVLQYSRSKRVVNLEHDLSVDALRHDQEWLSYSEPGGHELLVRDFLDTHGVDCSGLSVAGISWKDSRLVEVLARTPMPRILLGQGWHFDGKRSYWFDSVDAQNWVVGSSVAKPIPDIDVLVCRHLLEHASSPEAFLKGIRRFLGERSYLLLEVPDVEAAFSHFDYSVLWEEHRSYFTEDSLVSLLNRCRFSVIASCRMHVEGEDVILLLAQCHGNPNSISTVPESMIDAGMVFVREFERVRDSVQILLRGFRASGEILVLGANHVATNFIDLFADPGIVSAALDDNVRKQGKFVSLQRVPVRARTEVVDMQCALLINAIRSPKANEIAISVVRRLGNSPCILTPSSIFSTAVS